MLLSLAVRSYMALVVRSYIAELAEGGGGSGDADGDGNSGGKPASRANWYSARKAIKYQPLPPADNA